MSSQDDSWEESELLPDSSPQGGEQEKLWECFNSPFMKIYYDDMATEKAWGEPRQHCRLWRDRPHLCCPRRPSSSRFECQPSSALSRTTWVDIWTRLGGMRVIWESGMRWYRRWYIEGGTVGDIWCGTRGGMRGSKHTALSALSPTTLVEKIVFHWKF